MYDGFWVKSVILKHGPEYERKSMCKKSQKMMI